MHSVGFAVMVDTLLGSVCHESSIWLHGLPKENTFNFAALRSSRKPTFFVVSRTKCALVQINRNSIYVEVFETKNVDAEHIRGTAPAMEYIYTARFTKKCRATRV